VTVRPPSFALAVLAAAVAGCDRAPSNDTRAPAAHTPDSTHTQAVLPADSGTFRWSTPDAVVAVRVDVENEWKPIDVTPPPEAPQPAAPADTTPAENPPGGGDEDPEPLNLDGLGPRVAPSGATSATVLPRPVEITWPETARLKHCVGSHVDVRVLVGVDGTVRRVEPASTGVAADCIQIAVATAQKMRFTPGSVSGVAAELWTQVRIDFEKKK